MNDNRSSKNEDLSGGTADEDRPTADPFTEVLLDYASGRTIEPKLSADDQELMSGISDWLHMLPDAIANHPLVVQQPGPRRDSTRAPGRPGRTDARPG